MGSEHLPLQTKGIFHNLPTYPPTIRNLTAIVTGANGISGFHTMRVLLESAERWTKIYALSRRPPPPAMMSLLPESQRSRIQHIACDFLKDPSTIASALTAAGITSIDSIFFYSYLQPPPPPGSSAWSNASQLVDVNTTLLSNFLSALTLTHLTPRRFLLQTGAKHYGVHLGPARAPAIESDPRVELEPNFYYPQEDALFAFCNTHKGTGWNVIRPAWIIGAVENAQMNALHPLAVYAAVQAHRGLRLEFPGDLTSWQSEKHHSTAMLTGYLSEWAVLEEKCKDQAFNATDVSPLAWNRFWPELARWFGVEKGAGLPELDESKLQKVELGMHPTPLGYGPKGSISVSFSFVIWAQDPANHDAWRQIMASEGLTHDPFEDVEAHFTFADAAGSVLSLNLSMNKARRMGWTGFVDTTEALWGAYREMHGLGMLPRMKVDDPRPAV